MEYRINKVDVEIRQKVNETTKPNVIHTKEGLSVDAEQNKQEEKDLQWNKEEEQQGNNKKNKIVVEASKILGEEIIVNAMVDKNSKGKFLDTRK